MRARLLATFVVASLCCVPSARATTRASRDVCPPTSPGIMRCFARAHSNVTGFVRRPYGLSPSTIKSVYGFPTDPSAGTGKTIAIVTSYNAPHVEADLSLFSRQYGLPTCTTSNRCFLKVSQSGSTSSYPRTDAGWALETSMDVEWAHAIAPGADILLVEASSAGVGDFMKAEDFAKARAQYVSNSWGGS